MEKIIYSKTLKWQHESEYRLAVPLGENEKPYDTLSFHPEEITEMYLGLAMESKDMEVIVAKARAINPDIAIFQAKTKADGVITFEGI